ncbi:MAG: MmcQ/YjbR family DNA-binding protein [Pseudomonadota bacterium]
MAARRKTATGSKNRGRESKNKKNQAKDISTAVREVLLSFPEVEEYRSHGSPNFRVRGKTFAIYSVNHHGDGRIALLLDAPPGAQRLYTEGEPDAFFVPPYVGPKGWLGVELDKGLTWARIADLAREAYDKHAPRELRDTAGPTIRIDAPTMTLDPEDFDPMNHPGTQKKLARVREFCLALPEVSEDTTFGNPGFRAGKKSFCQLHRRERRLRLLFWAGGDAQVALTADERYTIPPYMGHNGWLSLDIEKRANWQEIEPLLLDSYRHFALKRMLKALDEG